MTSQADFTRFGIHLEVTIRQLREDDLPKLEWYGQFKHFRNLFRRSYEGQVKGYRFMLVATVNDFPIGRLFIQYGQSRSRLSDGRNRGYLYSFQVMEIFRGNRDSTNSLSKFYMIEILIGLPFLSLPLYQRLPNIW